LFWAGKLFATQPTDLRLPQLQGDRIGRIFANWPIVCFLSAFKKISEVHSKLSWATFFYGKSRALTLTKNGLTSFWAIFSKTHLVTLPQLLQQVINAFLPRKRRFPLFDILILSFFCLIWTFSLSLSLSFALSPFIALGRKQ
jgi:hypothetical protein